MCLMLAIYAVWCIYDLSWAPRCLFHAICGYDCPACGTLRAIRRVFAGDLRAAFLYNPYIWIISPYLMAVAVATFARGSAAKSLQPVVCHPAVVCLVGILTLAWWIFRNTPFWLAMS